MVLVVQNSVLCIKLTLFLLCVYVKNLEFRHVFYTASSKKFWELVYYIEIYNIASVYTTFPSK
jgi:hypothetical protein